MANETQHDNGTAFDKDKVLQRIKKMMSLANDGAASEGERDNAMRMIHATLAKYNLSMGEAEAAGEKAQEKRAGTYTTPAHMHPWEKRVAHAMAELFFCKYFYQASRTGHSHFRHCFIGKESNIYTSIEMTAYVCRSINTEAKRVSKELTGNAGGNYWRSFCKGASDMVWKRCIEIRRAAENAPKVPGTSLVLASLYQSEKIANDHHLVEVMGIGRLRSGNRTRAPGAEAYGAGRVFGSTVSLNRQVGGGVSNGKKQLN